MNLDLDIVTMSLLVNSRYGKFADTPCDVMLEASFNDLYLEMLEKRELLKKLNRKEN